MIRLLAIGLALLGLLGGLGGVGAQAQVVNSGSSTATSIIPGTNLSTGNVTATGGNTSITEANRAAFTINAADYGAKCDGVTDDTTALNAFFTALAAPGAYTPKAGRINSGICLFSSTLALPYNASRFASLLGAGQYATTLLYTGSSTTIDLFDVFGTSISVWSGPTTIGGFTIKSSTVMTGGVGLHSKWTSFITFEDINIGLQNQATNTLWNGIYFDETNFQRLFNYEIQAQNDGLQVSGQGVTTPPDYDLWVDGGKIEYAAVGVHVGGGFDNAYFDHSIVTHNNTNVLIDTALASFGNQEINFGPQFVVDQAQIGAAYIINDTLATPTYYCQITISGPVTNSENGGAGIDVKNWPSCYVNIPSPYIINNAGSGIKIEDSTAIVSISGATSITHNTRYGVESTASNTNVFGLPYMANNTLGNYDTNTTPLVQSNPNSLTNPFIARGTNANASVTYDFLNTSNAGGNASSVQIAAGRLASGLAASITMGTFGSDFMAFAYGSNATRLQATLDSANVSDFSPYPGQTVALGQSSKPFSATYSSAYFTGSGSCSSGASPAACGSYSAGAIAVPTGTNPTLVVNTTAVTANSQILLTPDQSVAAKLSVTCNSTISTLTPAIVTARTTGTSFTVEIGATVATNPVCLNYLIIN